MRGGTHRGSQNITNGLGANLIFLRIPYVDLLFGPFEFSTPNESPGKKATTFEMPT